MTPKPHKEIVFPAFARSDVLRRPKRHVAARQRSPKNNRKFYVFEKKKEEHSLFYCSKKFPDYLPASLTLLRGSAADEKAPEEGMSDVYLLLPIFYLVGKVFRALRFFKLTRKVS